MIQEDENVSWRLARSNRIEWRTRQRERHSKSEENRNYRTDGGRGDHSNFDVQQTIPFDLDP